MAIDSVTRYAWAFPLKTRESKEIVEKLHTHVFLTAGPPKHLMCDRAAEFSSGEFKSLMKELSVTQKLCTPYNPTSNSAAERLNRTMLQVIRSLLLEYEDEQWDKVLPTAICFYNFGYHRSLKNSPFFLMYGRDPNIPYEAILAPVPHHNATTSARVQNMARCLKLTKDAITNTQDKSMQIANLKTKNRLDVGDIVYVKERYIAKRDHKLLPKYCGPLRIMELLGPEGTPGACILKSIKTGRTRQVGLKDVKLVPREGITKTENGNSEQVFPIHDINVDIPDTVQSLDIARHDDVSSDVDVDTEGIEMVDSTAVEQTIGKAVSCDSHKPMPKVTSTRRSVSMPKKDTLQLPAPNLLKGEQELKPSDVCRSSDVTGSLPIASRTRARNHTTSGILAARSAASANAPDAPGPKRSARLADKKILG